MDGLGIGQKLRIGAVEQAQHHGGEIDVGLVLAHAIGQAIEQGRQLVRHVGGERGQAAPELRAADRGDGDLLEEDAAVAVGRNLDEEEVERAFQGTLRIEDIELGLDGLARVLDHLIDRRDQQVFLRDEVVMDQARGHARIAGDALHRGVRQPVLHDGGTKTVDDLTAARLGEARTTHRVDWLADQPINVKTDSWFARRDSSP